MDVKICQLNAELLLIFVADSCTYRTNIYKDTITIEFIYCRYIVSHVGIFNTSCELTPL
jgi:hypothetical protein